jgi:beta-barrel assembly-enhancing protease
MPITFLLACTMLVSLMVTTGIASPETSSGKSTKKADIKFGKPEVELLNEANLLDQKMDKEGLVLHDKELNEYLNNLGNSLVPDHARKMENVVWNFRVARDPLVNAFALPNGSIYINTGLLAMLKTEGQLASILSHEITHVTNRHTYQYMKDIRKKVVVMNVLELVGTWNPLGGAVGGTIALISTVSPILVVSTMYGYSRELEREADVEGMETLVARGYSPNEFLECFRRMKIDYEAEHQRHLFLNSHPEIDNRINYLSKVIEEKKLNKTPTTSQTDRYPVVTRQALIHDIQLEIRSNRFYAAHGYAKKLTEDFSDSPESYYWLAESLRNLGPRALAPEKPLSDKERKEIRKRKRKYTTEEEEEVLLQKPEGKQNQSQNFSKAEQLYQKCLELNQNYANAYLGLGMLREKQGKKEEAITYYTNFLKLNPESIESVRITRRVEKLSGKEMK